MGLMLYPGGMAAPSHDWHFSAWLRYFDKKQADVVRDLEWNKSKASLMANGKQPYTRKEINELAAYLEIRPYELLMSPDDAMALRRLRQDAVQVVKSSEILERDQEAVRTGTDG